MFVYINVDILTFFRFIDLDNKVVNNTNNCEIYFQYPNISVTFIYLIHCHLKNIIDNFSLISYVQR